MTTPKDDLNIRRQSTGWGESRENTVGVNLDGFVDPSAEFPKIDHHYGSSVSKYARGNKVVSLDVPGVSGTSAETGAKPSSTLPYSNIKETPSGHIIEINDTPGAESLTVIHRTGTGVELRPDGSMVISTRRNRIEVVAADHSLVVEGDGAMTYKGNMTLNVSGDYNVNVGGDYKLNVAGDMAVDVFGDARRRVVKRDKEEILGDQDIRIVGHRASLCLQDDFHTVGGEYTAAVAGSVEIASGGMLSMSAKTEFSLVSVKGTIVAVTLNAMGTVGVIGGKDMTHYGKVYTGPAGENGPGSAVMYYGNLSGIATEALTAQNAVRAREAYTSFWANGADRANTSAGDGPMPTAGTNSTILVDPDFETFQDWPTGNTKSPGLATPNADVVYAILGRSYMGVRNVVVDPADNLADQLNKTEQYQGQFNRTPTEGEIRENLRGKKFTSEEDAILTAQLVAEGRLSPEWDRITPPGTNRIAGSSPSVQSGRTPVGVQTDPTTNKRFIPKA
jgi:hypothetical protein